MRETEFEAALRRDGFAEVEVKSVAPGTVNADHAHAFDVRALVLAGDITLTAGGQSRTYREGEAFTMTGGHEHAEAIGPDGVRFLIGRRRPPAA